MCDGVFLIEDTARHNGFTPDTQEMVEHISQCPECQETAEAFDQWAEIVYDADAPILCWPDDETLAGPDRLEEVDGHA